MFWWKTERDGGGRARLWGLSMNLATFTLVSMRQAFLVTVEKLASRVDVSNMVCHIRSLLNVDVNRLLDCEAERGAQQ